MAGKIDGLALGMIAIGGVSIYGGLYNQSYKAILQSVLKGQQPQAGPKETYATPAGSTAPTSGGLVPAGSVSPTGGNPGSAAEKANQATARLMAGSYGWSTGAEWAALNNIIMAESGWNNEAQNPNSTAYGIFQFLDTTWATVGYTKTSDPVTQIAAGLAYIKQRYGDPVKAWQFHLANGYY